MHDPHSGVVLCACALAVASVLILNPPSNSVTPLSMGQGASKDGRTLCEAVKREDAECVRVIVAQHPETVLHHTFWKRKTPLMLACERGNVLIATTILWASEQSLGPGYRSYLNDPAANGNTALILACKNGHAPVARVLLEEGASPLLANRRGETAVHVAALRNHSQCLEVVLAAPLRPMGGSGGAAPVAAMAPVRDHAGETRFIDAHDRAGFTALHLAAISRAASAVAILVRCGATIDVPVLRGMERMPFLCGGSTPLHISAAQGDARTCIVLLEGQRRHPGLELRRIRNMLGLTPLNCALLGGHHEVVRILVDPGLRHRLSGGGGGGSSNTLSGGGGGARDGVRSRHQGRGGGHHHHHHHHQYRMVPLHASFPESLRSHMLAVLQRAQLLLQLRQIAGGWKGAGVERPSDGVVSSLPGLDSLSLSQVRRLQRLLRRQDTSLRDVLYGLEEALHRDATTTNNNSSGSGSGSGEEEHDNDGVTEDGDGDGTNSNGSSTASVDWRLLGASESQRLTSAAGAASAASPRRTPSHGGGGGGERGEADSSPAALRASMGHHYTTLERTLHEISELSGGGNATLMAPPTATATSAASSQTNAGHKPSLQTTTTTTPPPFPMTEDCAICMDSAPEVAFKPCDHSMCFQCACRLCVRGSEATTCPFCRREVESVFALSRARARVGDQPHPGDVAAATTTKTVVAPLH